MKISDESEYMDISDGSDISGRSDVSNGSDGSDSRDGSDVSDGRGSQLFHTHPQQHPSILSVCPTPTPAPSLSAHLTIIETSVFLLVSTQAFMLI